MTAPPVTDDLGDWAQVPGWVIDRCTTLTPVCLNTYVLLALYRNWKTGEAWPSLGVLAERLGCSEPVARRALHTLRDEGLIRIEARRDEAGRQTTNRYWIARVDPDDPREGGVALTRGPETGSDPGESRELGSRGRQGGPSRQRDPNETSNEREEETPAGASADAPKRTAKQDRDERAQTVLDAYWTWYREKRGVAPPEHFPAIKVMVSQLLADFTDLEVKRALVILDEQHRAITRQGLHDAMLDLRSRHPGQAHDPEAAARLAEQQEIARRELEDEGTWRPPDE